MDESTEGKTISPAGGHVTDLDSRIVRQLPPAPLLECHHSWYSSSTSTSSSLHFLWQDSWDKNIYIVHTSPSDSSSWQTNTNFEVNIIQNMGDVKVFFHSILLMTSQSVQYLIYGNLISPRDDVGQWQYYCHCCTTDNLAITVAIVPGSAETGHQQRPPALVQIFLTK